MSLNKGKKSQPRARTNLVYQLKITLRGAKPPIWRRIQVQDCTLDKLHEHIQAAMGWSNSHLHQFTIAGENYGDPELLEDDFGILDSTKTRLSQFTPAEGCKFRFHYEYDFGDGWEHDILIEKCQPAETGEKYPRCLTGKGACPPEDCGGVWGYADRLKAIANPKHQDHPSTLEWLGRGFDPERFDPAQATESMQAGVPNWRLT